MENFKECYICKKFNVKTHGFYPDLCLTCGELNLQKRDQTTDLHGYTVLVTGGRLKIGFETALKFLRCGAKVIVTTRFEENARVRFSHQADFAAWKDRLKIYTADFRFTQFVENLIQWIYDTGEGLDILINNAAQTIRRPPAFYRHLFSDNEKPRMIEAADGEDIVRWYTEKQELAVTKSETLPARISALNNPDSVAYLSQLPLIPGDEVIDAQRFPAGRFDKDGQQEDRRDINSWMMKLEDIHLVEFLEVLNINVVAPFLLCSRLKKLMCKAENDRPSFIVNVSAMEGNFFDPEKNWRHPHTNMAKAALNMMTRTSASDFQQERIFMTSVDPGWITNERPFPLEIVHSMRKTKMAIDEIDGAARICDPIFRALNENECLSGVLLKNYKVYPW